MSSRFAIYTASFVHADGTLQFTQIHGSDVMFGQSIHQEFPGGAVDRGWSILGFAESKGGLATYDLKKIVDTVPLLTGLKCTSGATLRGRRRDDSGTFSSGDDHALFASAVGWLGVTGISARQGSVPAEAGLQYWSLYNGSVKPWTFTKAGAANNGSAPAVNSCYFLGPVYVNGTQLTDVQSVDLIPGLEYRWIAGDGDVFPRNGAIYLRRSEIRITLNSLDAYDTLAALYLTEATNFDVYLKRGATGDNGRVAAGTASHLKIRCSSAAVQPSDIGGRGNDDYAGGMTILPNGQWTSAESALP